MLTFNLKKKWFDKIKNGEKTHEYREMSDYWVRRIHPIRYDNKPLNSVGRYMSDFEKGIGAIKFTYSENTSYLFRHNDEIEDAAFRVENYVNGKDGLWMLKRHNRSTPSRCLSLDIGLACGYTLYF